MPGKDIAQGLWILERRAQCEPGSMGVLVRFQQMEQFLRELLDGTGEQDIIQEASDILGERREAHNGH